MVVWHSKRTAWPSGSDLGVLLTILVGSFWLTVGTHVANLPKRRSGDTFLAGFAMESDLLTICGIALGAVLFVLGLLSVSLRLLTSLFPDDSPEADPALMKAIEEAVGQAFPGAKLVSVEADEME